MPQPLASRIALVTGASRGIGYATARTLAKAGAHIVAVARTQGGLEELDDEIRKDGGSATLVPLNLTDYDGIIRLAAAPTTDNPRRISPITYSRSCKTNDNKPPDTVPRMLARKVDDSSTPLPFDKTCGCKISGIAPYFAGEKNAA